MRDAKHFILQFLTITKNALFFGEVKRHLSTGVLDKILSMTLTDIAGSTPEITQNKPYISARMSKGLFGIASRETHAQGLYIL